MTIQLATRWLPLSLCSVLVVTETVSAQSELQRLVPPVEQSNMFFGDALAFDGARIFVGAPGSTPHGAVHVHDPVSGSWSLTDVILPSPGQFDPSFGEALLFHEGQLLVGGPNYGTGERPGGVYVLEESGGQFVEQQILQAGDIDDQDRFGAALAAHGDYALIGAPKRDPFGFDAERGAVYLFQRQAGTWVELERWLAPNHGPYDRFGSRVALTAQHAAIVAPGADGADVATGAVFLYELVGGTWQYIQKVYPPGVLDSDTPFTIALDGDTLLVGAMHADPGGLPQTERGAAFVFEFDGSSWNLVESIQAVDSQHGDRFGSAVALGEGIAAIGAYRKDSGARLRVGATYLYDRTVSPWRFQAKLTPLIDERHDRFGNTLAIEGDRVLVGSVTTFQDGTLSVGAVTICQAPSFAETYCFCDSSVPCSNPDETGGCDNGRDQGARLGAAGSASVSADDLVLQTYFMDELQFGIYMMGPDATLLPFGDGQRCVSGASGPGTVRFPSALSDGLGALKLGPGIGALAVSLFGPNGQIDAGDTWRFQAWFRDPHGPCGSGFNLSNAIAVTFVP